MTGKTAAAKVQIDKEEHKTVLWWHMLSAVAIFNIMLWARTAWILPTDATYVQSHIVLSGIFTTVCAFRSFMPRIDLERYCIVDSKFSSVVAGRSAATVAEISFATQVGLLMQELGHRAGVQWVESMTIPVILTLTTA